jgi:hypothetical protein
MEPPLPSEFDDLDDMPTVPGVYIIPWAAHPDTDSNPLLDDPTSWDEDDTKRFLVIG